MEGRTARLGSIGRDAEFPNRVRIQPDMAINSSLSRIHLGRYVDRPTGPIAAVI